MTKQLRLQKVFMGKVVLCTFIGVTSVLPMLFVQFDEPSTRVMLYKFLAKAGFPHRLLTSFKQAAKFSGHVRKVKKYYYTLIFDPQPASTAKSMHRLKTADVNSGHSIPKGSSVFLVRESLKLLLSQK